MDRYERQMERAKLAALEAHVGAARLALRRAIEGARDRPVQPELKAIAKQAEAVDLVLLNEIQRLSTD